MCCFRVDTEIILVCFFISLIATFTCSVFIYFTAKNETNPYDFCAPKLCDVGLRHIGCKPRGFAPNCLKPTLIVFTNRLKRLILKNHNTLRNRFAAGNIYGFKPAARLATLKWNVDLAHLASINSKYCSIHYHECYSTEEFRFPGQNIAIVSVNDKRRVHVETINKLIGDIVNVWFMEIKKAKQQILDEFEINECAKIFNFSNIVHERTTELGCGMTSYFNQNRKLRVVLVCNYSFRPYPGLPIYTAGKSCSKCKTGCNINEYPFLCNRLERIRSDNTTIK